MYYVRTAYVCIYIIIIYTTLFTVQGTAATKQFKKNNNWQYDQADTFVRQFNNIS